MARPVREFEQVAGGDGREQHAGPDHVVDAAAVVEVPAGEVEGRDGGDAVVAVEQLQLAEQEVEADAPGDGAERQVMAGEAHRDEAEHQGGRAGDGQRHRQRGPRRPAVAGGEHRRGEGAEAAEGRLSERGEPADARQHDEAERHQRAQADIVEERDPEHRHARQHRQHGGATTEQSGAAQHGAAPASACAWSLIAPHSSSSVCVAVSERTRSTGMMSMKTMISLKLDAQNEAKASTMPTNTAAPTASG